jgi:hypothetical protein
MMFGYREVKQFHRFENGKMVFYGYSIGFDRDGNETDRTEPEVLSKVGWDGGKPFTENDYRSIMSGGPAKKRGFWARLFGR